jgi:hypothetical protein
MSYTQKKRIKYSAYSSIPISNNYRVINFIVW